MKKITTLLFLAITFSSYAQSFRWDLQITNPDFELINYKLSKAQFKPYLKKTSWRCYTSETQEKGGISLKELTCNYSIEKTGIVTTAVSCSQKRPYSENYLKLYDERKDLSFQVMLKCQKSN